MNTGLPYKYTLFIITFIAFNLCQADSKARHQSPIFKKNHSIAVAKSNTTEMPNRVSAKSEKPFQRDVILTFF